MIFDWLFRSRRARLDQIIKESKQREQWYHAGPWWEHPLWRK